MDSKAMATQDKAKEKAPRDKQSNTKDTTVMNKEKEKDIYIYISGCYRCGQQGHTAKDCRVGVYNVQEDVYEGYTDATDQWYGQQTAYDNHWWTDDQTQISAAHQPQKRALPAPSQFRCNPSTQLQQLSESTRHEYDHKHQQG